MMIILKSTINRCGESQNQINNQLDVQPAAMTMAILSSNQDNDNQLEMHEDSKGARDDGISLQLERANQIIQQST